MYYRRLHRMLLFVLFTMTGASGVTRPALADSQLVAARPWTSIEGIDPVSGGWLSFDEAVPADQRRPSLDLVVPRGGVASGLAVTDKPVDVRITELRSPTGSLPADAVRIRYATRDEPRKLGGWQIARRKRELGREELDRYYAREHYDRLHAAPADRPGVHPIWITVTPPSDAAPGVYRGELRAGAASLPVAVEVSPFELPARDASATHLGFMWSYEEVARRFEVEPWSPDHWRRIAQLHRFLADAQNRPLVITVLADNYLGEEQGHVRFRREGETLVPDFERARRLIDAYAREVGRPDPLILHVWSMTHYGLSTKHARIKRPPRTEDVRVPVTVIENDGTPATVDIHPAYLPEGEPLWREVVEGIERIVASHDWPRQTLVLGSASDAHPRPETVETFQRIGPDIHWQIFSHNRGINLPTELGAPMVRFASGRKQTVNETYDTPGEPITLDNGMRVSYLEHVYAPGLTPRDDGILGGWNLPFKRYTCIRNYLTPSTPLDQYYAALSGATATGRVSEKALNDPALDDSDYVQRFGKQLIRNAYSGAGLTRLPLLPGRPNDQDLRRCFPGLFRGNPKYLLHVSDGPALAPTARFLALREGRQVTETRIVLERALTSSSIDGDLADRVRTFLADYSRTLSRDGRFSTTAGLGSGGYTPNARFGVAEDLHAAQQRMYQLAAEVQAAEPD